MAQDRLSSQACQGAHTFVCNPWHNAEDGNIDQPNKLVKENSTRTYNKRGNIAALILLDLLRLSKKSVHHQCIEFLHRQQFNQYQGSRIKSDPKLRQDIYSSSRQGKGRVVVLHNAFPNAEQG
jgi:hypothetical protein